MIVPHDPAWDHRLVSEAGPARAGEATRFIGRLPAGYRDLTTPTEALEDMDQVASLETTPVDVAESDRPAEAMGFDHRLVVRPPIDPPSSFRLRRFGRHGIELTSTLPLLESFGLVVVESAPLRLAASSGEAHGLHVDDIAVRLDAPYGEEAVRFVPRRHGPRLVEAIEASVQGRADVDSLNRLVTAAGLEWRQVTVLRAYLRYRHQLGPDVGWEDLAGPLVAYPDVARALVAYFQARFDPAGPAGGGTPRPAVDERTTALAQLDLVSSLAQDRVLRGLLGMIDATTRTNFFVTGNRALTLKFESRSVPEIPAPTPAVEAFVHAPTVEGIHLRAGLIARGGIRWSERPSDFRTEVLDLAFAQVKKNAIIVPTGAKGGFVCRAATVGPRMARPGERATPERVRDAYELFVASLLEVTDNLVSGEVVSPPGVVAADGPDPYLVVAADKGTATFSDLANSISERNRFWLGDAFASGGSHGYDHKAMGITARGAWVAVRRHFRELAVDVSTDAVTVAGVGDMSGDVFGNGMLQSRSLRLVAAFDHRHVFLDPEPHPERAFEERSRLAGLPRSSWADYRSEVISPGGGVWPRDAKSIPLSAPVRVALGVDDAELTPPRLVRAILAAPVDLLWFGGIGTFVKAPGEADAEVGDHANDDVRITSDLLRARVVTEGANLAVTQQARIRYSRRGGRINADFIDNAAGVATSDREVNIKILLALAIERGRLEPARRDEYLSGAQAEVADQVLVQVDHSVSALNRAMAGSEWDLDAYEALVEDLERTGRLDRAVEMLPDRAEFGLRRQAGAGLIRPELATIMAYAKSDLVAALEASPLVSDQVFRDAVTGYFPAAIRADFSDLIPDHRLYPQLVATDVAGEMVDRMGIVWAHDLAAELGRPLQDVAAAFWVARTVTGAGELWAQLEAATVDLPVGAEAALHSSVSSAVGGLARRYLVGRDPFVPAAAADRDLALLRDRPDAVDGRTAPVYLVETRPDIGTPGVDPQRLAVAPATAARFAAAGGRVAAVESGWLAASSARPVSDCAAALDAVGRAAGLDRVAALVGQALQVSPPPGRYRRWQGRALFDDLTAWRTTTASRLLSLEPASWPSVLERWGPDPLSGLVEAGERPGTDPLAVASIALRRLGRDLAL